MKLWSLEVANPPCGCLAMSEHPNSLIEKYRVAILPLSLVCLRCLFSYSEGLFRDDGRGSFSPAFLHPDFVDLYVWGIKVYIDNEEMC